MIEQGDIWWADLGQPLGSAPGYVRPVAIVQGSGLNRSRIATVVCIPMTTTMKWANAVGGVMLPARATGLGGESVAQAAAIVTIDRSQLRERVGRLPREHVSRLFRALDLVLDRSD